MLALAGPAAGVRVSVSVENDGAPRVWFVSPQDGDRLPVGDEVLVRAQSENGEVLSVLVDGTTAWSVHGDALQGSWAPDLGRHRLVAVAERPGAPDAVAAIEVVGVKASAAAPGVAPGPADPAPPAATPGTGSAPQGPGGVLVSPPRGGPGTFRPAPAGPPRATPVAPLGGGRAVDRDPTAGPASAGNGGGDGGGGGGWRGWLSRILHDPEMVAWGVALPLLLIAAAIGYLLLQRFIDGGQKLAWRGRGRPDDTIVEF